MRHYQVTRLRGLRVIETREGDKPGVWHVLDALLCSGVKAIGLTDIQETGQRNVQQELLYAGEATRRLYGSDEGCRIVGQEPRLALRCDRTIVRLSVGDVRCHALLQQRNTRLG